MTRVLRYCVLVVALVLAGGLPGQALAHGDHSGPIQTFRQMVGPYEIGVTLELPPSTPAPLFVDIVPPDDIGAATITMRAVPRGHTFDRATPVQVTTIPGPQSVYYSELEVDRAGEWELELQVAGPAGEGVARVPFTLATTPLPPYSIPLFGALGALVVLMISSILIAAVFNQRRAPMPGWLSWLLGRALFAAVIVAVIFGAQQLNASFREASAADGTSTATYGRPHANMAISTAPAAPQVGQPLTLTLRLSDGGTGLPVDDLVPHHEALIHLLVIGEDGSFFEHTHPPRLGPGYFAIELTPTRPGRYNVYAEVERVDSGTQIIRRAFEVGGPAAPAPPAAPGLGVRTIDDVQVEVSSSREALKAGQQATLTFSLSNAEGPLLDLQPWLGMAGHLLVQSEDQAILGHVHAAERLPPRGRPIVANNIAYGPDIRFVYTFPEAGSYLAWGQFKHAGQIITVPLTLEVAP